MSRQVKTLLCYISGHGFGHAVRVMEVLRALWTRQADLVMAIRTAVPRWFFELGLGGPFSHAPCTLDIGAVQRDSLSVDPEATLRAYAEIVARREALIANEVNAARAVCPALVFADIPALAFDIAARLGVPGVAMTNFSWDWIYADYLAEFGQYASFVDDLRRSYARADLLLRLPLHGDLSAFPVVRDTALVARTAKLAPAEVRRRLGLSQRNRHVLLSFGGIGITLSAVPAAPPHVTFVATQSATERAAAAPGCCFISNLQLAAANVRYEDLVAACDVVMTKPGYGIVSDCIANGTPIIYTSRGRFVEYECLVQGIQAHLPHAFISNTDLYSGQWTAALEAVFAQPRRTPALDCNGAAMAADALWSFLR